MCGILGLYNTKGKDVAAALALLSARGQDGAGWESIQGKTSRAKKVSNLQISENGMGHVLHSIIGECVQPLKKDGTIVANCEIYNWKELAKKHTISAKNDAEVLLAMLDNLSELNEEKVLGVLEELDGVYAFAYKRKEQIILARDIIGVKPLWYSHQDGFSFSSEKKVLEELGMFDISDLNPRSVLSYDTEKNLLCEWKRNFTHTKEISTKSEEEIAQEVKELLIKAVEKRIPNKNIKVGVLFSGGIDSTLIAKILQDKQFDVTCYTAVYENPRGEEAHDLTAAKSVAENYGFKHKIISIKEENIPKLAEETTKLIEEANAVKVAVGMPFLAASKKAKKDGCKILFSGLGAEELYAGYQRHKNSSDVNDECFAGLLWMYERDLYRDDVITMRNGLELRVPLLDKELIKHALSIPSEFKIRRTTQQSNVDGLEKGIEKYILRKAAELLGIKKEDAYRPKKAAQYGSKFDIALKRVANKEGKNRVEYLQNFLGKTNRKIGVLCSGGKDSWYAAYVMKKLNYELSCTMLMKSTNQDSYMFHTPAIELVKLQSEAADLPLVEQETAGEKEKELEDLKTLLKQSKEEHKIEGVVTGALFSQYQRERIEKLCTELNLKVYAPLWHLEQASELKELLREGFVITMSSIAGEGMNKEWLGKEIGEAEVQALLTLRDSIGFNVAGEGGEYESLVLNCPLFSKKLCIDFKKEMENEITGRLSITKAWLKEKN